MLVKRDPRYLAIRYANRDKRSLLDGSASVNLENATNFAKSDAWSTNVSKDLAASELRRYPRQLSVAAGSFSLILELRWSICGTLHVLHNVTSTEHFLTVSHDKFEPGFGSALKEKYK